MIKYATPECAVRPANPRPLGGWVGQGSGGGWEGWGDHMRWVQEGEAGAVRLCVKVALHQH